jgi:hypothetical protein
MKTRATGWALKSDTIVRIRTIKKTRAWEWRSLVLSILTNSPNIAHSLSQTRWSRLPHVLLQPCIALSSLQRYRRFLEIFTVRTCFTLCD